MNDSASSPAEVICFGVGEGWPSGTRRHASFLYRFGVTRVLVDCGDGMSLAFKAAGVSYDAVDAVFLSHMHSDHVGGFSMFIQSAWLEGRRRPLPVFAPAQAIPALQAWLIATLLPPELLQFNVVWTPLAAAQPCRVGEVTVTPAASSHLDSFRSSFGRLHPAAAFDAFSFGLAGAGTRAAHSADIGAVADLEPLLAEPPQLLVCELSHVELDPLLALLRKRRPAQAVFVHLAREHLADVATTERRLREGLDGVPFTVGRDGDAFGF